jgi:hypothetical protein
VSERDLDALAETYAAAGREELLERFRAAYARALGSQADLVNFDAERVDAMVERSAAEADGLQWRRALAGVAARDLGIDLGSALTHPAVIRAHQLSGAPSYESALAALAVPVPTPISAHATVTPAPVPAPITAVPDPPAAVPDPPAAAPDPPAAEIPPPAAVPAPTIVIPSTPPAPAAPTPASEREAPDEVLAHRADGFAAEFMAGAATSPPGRPATAENPASAESVLPPALEGDDPADSEAEVAVPMDGDTFEQEAIGFAHEAAFGAVHLGGVASLPTSAEIDVHLSADGLDLLEGDGEILGRLGWADISALEVTVPHGRRRRKGAPRLVVHTAGGSARFEVPGLSGEELQAQVAPLMERYGH